jgi:hypothetical protein
VPFALRSALIFALSVLAIKSVSLALFLRLEFLNKNSSFIKQRMNKNRLNESTLFQHKNVLN